MASPSSGTRWPPLAKPNICRMFFILTSRHARPEGSADDDQRPAAAAAYLFLPKCSLPSGTIIITFRDPTVARRPHPEGPSDDGADMGWTGTGVAAVRRSTTELRCRHRRESNPGPSTSLTQSHRPAPISPASGGHGVGSV